MQVYIIVNTTKGKTVGVYNHYTIASQALDEIEESDFDYPTQEYVIDGPVEVNTTYF
jgi:hypothetical protein